MQTIIKSRNRVVLKRDRAMSVRVCRGVGLRVKASHLFTVSGCVQNCVVVSTCGRNRYDIFFRPMLFLETALASKGLAS